MPHKATAARRHHIPRPKRRVTNSAEYDAALRQPDRLVHRRGDRGLESGDPGGRYNLRALVEVQIGRFKQVIGDALRSHTDEAQVTEIAIPVEVLNRMLDLGRPKSVRVG